VKHGERKTLLDENQGSGDDSGIVAKEEPAESGERGGNVDEGGAFRLPRRHASGCVRVHFPWGHLSSVKSGWAGRAAKTCTSISDFFGYLSSASLFVFCKLQRF